MINTFNVYVPTYNKKKILLYWKSIFFSIFDKLQRENIIYVLFFSVVKLFSIYNLIKFHSYSEIFQGLKYCVMLQELVTQYKNPTQMKMLCRIPPTPPALYS